MLNDGEVYKQEMTCSICNRTERLSVWSRIAEEQESNMVISRTSKSGSFTCPMCVKAGKNK